MVSKAQSNYIRSLATAAGRHQSGHFVVEGPKLAAEWLEQCPQTVQFVVSTESWSQSNLSLLKKTESEVLVIPAGRMEALSQLRTPPEVLLVVAIPEPVVPVRSGWTLVCETLQDPGNLGTLLRIADWYGIASVVASPDSADFYNPKVVQAAMGAHLRLHLHRMEPEEYLMTDNRTMWAATLHGDSLYAACPASSGILLIGNESKGLSGALVARAHHQVTIPRRGGAESLNAAVAAGILCDRLIAV